MITKLVAGGLAALALLAGGAAQASTWVFTGTNANSLPVSASADISLTGGLLTVDLSNLGDNMTASNQAISGIFVTFDSAATGASGFTQSGALMKINDGGTTTAVAGNPTHWGGSVVGSDVRIWTLTGGPPDDLIAQSSSKNFSGVNNGADTHNPYIDGTGHFTLNVAGGATQVTGVSFLFATDQSGPHYQADCTNACTTTGGVPEPATWALMIVGFGGAGAMLRRRRTLAAA